LSYCVCPGVESSDGDCLGSVTRKYTFNTLRTGYLLRKTAFFTKLITPAVLHVWAFSLKVQWVGHEADHSPPSSAKVKNVWSYFSTPHTSP
jgi:hypothetical protein